MIALSTTSMALQVVLDAAPNSQFTCYAAYEDHTASAYGPGGTGRVSTNSTTAATVVSGPSVSTTTREIIHFFTYNQSNSTRKLTVRVSDGGATTYDLPFTLLPNAIVQYSRGRGWETLNNKQELKLSGSTDGRPIIVQNTSDPGTTIHTSLTSTLTQDLVDLYISNTSSTDELFALQIGTTGVLADEIYFTIPAKTAVFPMLVRFPIYALACYSTNLNVLTVTGSVLRIPLP